MFSILDKNFEDVSIVIIFSVSALLHADFVKVSHILGFLVPGESSLETCCNGVPFGWTPLSRIGVLRVLLGEKGMRTLSSLEETVLARQMTVWKS